MTILSNLAIRDIETLAHPNTNLAALRETGPLVLEHGKGVFVHDSEGKAYLEGMAGESEEDFATRLAAELDEMIQREGPDTIAAFIAEPVMGAGGVIVPPKTYFEKVAEVCGRYEVYMIADEV